MKFLIIGGGSIGMRHFRNLQILGYENISVLKREPAADFAKVNNVHVLNSYEQAAALKFDSIIVATPTALHNEGLFFAIKNQCNIFMEKPLIHNKEGMVLAKEKMADFTGTFFIGFMLRFHPLIQKIKELIAAERLGPVYSARFSFGSFLPNWHPWEDYTTSYASKIDMGGGVINTITHELDLIQYLFGLPKSIFCLKNNQSILNIDADEQCEAIFEYEDKCISLHLDYLQKGPNRSVEIICEKGAIKFNWKNQTLVISEYLQDEEIIQCANFDLNQMYIDELKDFVDKAIRNQKTHALDFNHALKNTELMLLMHQSADERKLLKYNGFSKSEVL